MAIIDINLPYNSLLDPATGEPMFNAQIFIGEVDQDPEQNPKQVQLRNQGGAFVNISQPIRTNAAGVPIYNGNPVQLFVDGDYSSRIKNQFGVTVFTSWSSSDENADSLRASNNLSDVDSVATAVSNLGLTGSLLAPNNLSDLANVVTARTNLGLENALLSNNNLSDVDDAAAARANLGIASQALSITNTTLFSGSASSGTQNLDEDYTTFDVLMVEAVASDNHTNIQWHLVDVIDSNVTYGIVARVGATDNGGIAYNFPSATTINITLSDEGGRLNTVRGINFSLT